MTRNTINVWILLIKAFALSILVIPTTTAWATSSYVDNASNQEIVESIAPEAVEDEASDATEAVPVDDDAEYESEAPGSGASVSATMMAADGTANAASANKKLMYLSANPSKPTIHKGDTVSVTITGTNTDGSTGNFTRLCKWKSAKTSVATVAGGKIKGVKTGITSVSATFGGKSTSIYVTVISNAAKNELLRITATPSTSSIKKNRTVSVKIQAVYGNGSTKDVTSSCTWKSTRTYVATVSRGTIRGVKAGLAIIEASFGGKTATIVITVK